MADTNASEETTIDASQKQHETVDEMLARHRQEIKQLQNKETELKKAAAKGSKAEQKAKKKQVEEDISKLSTKLKDKQLKELASQGFSSSGNIISKAETNEKKGDIDTLVRAIAGVSVTAQQEHSKPSKSVKRREKRAKEEADREQRIKEEQSNVTSDRMVENQKLDKKLKPMGLTISEIKPDGHCLYRAVENQLANLSGGGASPYTYQKLREMAAAYMRDHKTDFIPFLFLSETESESNAEEWFEIYCRQVESTAAWGGQLELGALTHCLRKHIIVFSGSFPDVEMGKEYKSDNDSSLMLSYHRHAFGLGEHYNSVVVVTE
ncbi:hypothetical protein N665_6413s0003 [Sinapis alba]|nr:hypothetical protein N665_6413s0003 [Sinapis alba]KAF8044837.1 hypothetical protein N665_6413s0003 [Sinapis alba]